MSVIQRPDDSTSLQLNGGNLCYGDIVHAVSTQKHNLQSVEFNSVQGYVVNVAKSDTKPVAEATTAEEKLYDLISTHARRNKSDKILYQNRNKDPRILKKYLEEVLCVNFQEIIEFTGKFRSQRIGLGLSQRQVACALRKWDGKTYAQTAISRFEMLDMAVVPMTQIYPRLIKWMELAQTMKLKGSREFNEFIGISSPKRRRLDYFGVTATRELMKVFKKASHPAIETVSRLSEELDCDEKSILLWFQKQRISHKLHNKKRGIPAPNAALTDRLSSEEPNSCNTQSETGCNKQSKKKQQQDHAGSKKQNPPPTKYYMSTAPRTFPQKRGGFLLGSRSRLQMKIEELTRKCLEDEKEMNKIVPDQQRLLENEKTEPKNCEANENMEISNVAPHNHPRKIVQRVVVPAASNELNNQSPSNIPQTSTTNKGHLTDERSNNT